LTAGPREFSLQVSGHYLLGSKSDSAMSISPPAPQAARTPRFRFDRHELAGAFGDIGTDLPLLVALITTCGLLAVALAVVALPYGAWG
jgi:hypothetical protein